MKVAYAYPNPVSAEMMEVVDSTAAFMTSDTIEAFHVAVIGLPGVECAMETCPTRRNRGTLARDRSQTSSVSRSTCRVL
jgi:hypothetical protein